jgi:hypothetical protein
LVDRPASDVSPVTGCSNATDRADRDRRDERLRRAFRIVTGRSTKLAMMEWPAHLVMVFSFEGGSIAVRPRGENPRKAAGGLLAD